MRTTGIGEVRCVTIRHRNRRILRGSREHLANIAKHASLTCKQKDGEVPLLFDGTAPIPGARQPSVDATASIVKVIRPRAVEPVPEEIRKNFLDETIDGTKFLFDEPVNARVVLETGDLTEGGSDGKQDTVDLGVLVDEHQSVRDVVVTFGKLIYKNRERAKGTPWLTHVNDGGADPCPDALLSAVEDNVHHSRRLWSRLDTV